ncbi:NlpC/P60 family protein, partial [Jatrophihabitans sp.]|uniref:C40 family peptidase n=1 Tax=Jatrophihabitans sp. TaxID=1932789 RepID=UPI0030C6D963|nr:NlpC/P60 family protein [Jatrophihabitans sp.]
MARNARRIAAVAVFAVASLAITVGATAPAAADPKFPSWGEVQNAKRSVSAKKAEIAKLEKLIGSLQNQAAAAGKVAAVRGEEYLNARGELDTATATAKKLKQQADAATKRAGESEAEAGQLSAQFARTGNGDVTLDLLLNGHQAGDLLDVLGTMNKLSASVARVFAVAEQDQKVAKALGDQAKVAQGIRAKKKTAAAKALASATAAATAAKNKVTAGNKSQGVMTSQLASLQGKSAKILAQYYAGVAWEKKQEEQTTPPPDPPSNGGGGGGGGSSGPPSAPNGSAVAGAISFARAQLGKPYVLDGAGPNVWDCSGLTLKAYAAVGVYIGTHSATNQYDTLRSEGRLVPLSERQAGDLVWYSDG